MATQIKPSTVELEHSTKILNVTKKIIVDEKFKILDNRRRISMNVVRDLAQMLRDGKHFDSPIVVNHISKSDTYEIIDGNHRWEAVKLFVNQTNGNTVQVQIAAYEDLDDGEKKELFTKWNKGRKQTTNDVVQQYAEDIPILKHFEKSTFPTPITIYGQNGTISVFKIIGAYLAAKRSQFQGSYIGDPFDFIEEAAALKAEDAKTIAGFLVDFEGAFGPIKNNRWARTTPFNALFRIWYDNRFHLGPEKIQRMWQSRLATNAQMADLGNASGASACVMVRETYLQGLNASRQKDLFIKSPNETAGGSNPVFPTTV